MGFNFTSAEISYLASEDASEPNLGYTSGPGEGGIMAFKAFDRKFSPHILDWVAFTVMTTPSLMIPFALWYSSKSKYDNMSKSKKLMNVGEKLMFSTMAILIEKKLHSK